MSASALQINLLRQQNAGVGIQILPVHSAPWITGEGQATDSRPKSDQMRTVWDEASISVNETSWDKQSQIDIFAPLARIAAP